MNALKEFIDSHHLPFTAAAKMAGTSFTNIYRHYHGERGISSKMALRYHEAFGIPLEALIRRQSLPSHPLPSLSPQPDEAA